MIKFSDEPSNMLADLYLVRELRRQRIVARIIANENQFFFAPSWWPNYSWNSIYSDVLNEFGPEDNTSNTINNSEILLIIF